MPKFDVYFEISTEGNVTVDAADADAARKVVEDPLQAEVELLYPDTVDASNFDHFVDVSVTLVEPFPEDTLEPTPEDTLE